MKDSHTTIGLIASIPANEIRFHVRKEQATSSKERRKKCDKINQWQNHIKDDTFSPQHVVRVYEQQAHTHAVRAMQVLHTIRYVCGMVGERVRERRKRVS